MQRQDSVTYARAQPIPPAHSGTAQEGGAPRSGAGRQEAAPTAGPGLKASARGGCLRVEHGELSAPGRCGQNPHGGVGHLEGNGTPAACSARQWRLCVTRSGSGSLSRLRRAKAFLAGCCCGHWAAAVEGLRSGSAGQSWDPRGNSRWMAGAGSGPGASACCVHRLKINVLEEVSLPTSETVCKGPKP